MSKLTKLCQGQPCYVRLPGICGDPETVFSAHIRLSCLSGYGIKANDIFACPACMNCHDAVDRRRYLDLDREYVRLAHFEGLVRWQNELIDREIIAATI